MDNQWCPRLRRQHTNAHPRGWPLRALMGGQGGTQRRHTPVPPSPSTCSWRLNPVREALDSTLGLRSEAEERRGRMGRRPREGRRIRPMDRQDGPVGRLQGSGTSRRAGRVPLSFPQEPTSPLLPGDLVLRCGIHISHTVPSAHSPTRPPYSFLPFSEPSLSAPPTAILQMSPTLNTLNPTQTQALHANPIRSLSWIPEQGGGQGTPPRPLPQPLQASRQPPSGQTRKPWLPPTWPATPSRP